MSYLGTKWTGLWGLVSSCLVLWALCIVFIVNTHQKPTWKSAPETSSRAVLGPCLSRATCIDDLLGIVVQITVLCGDAGVGDPKRLSSEVKSRSVFVECRIWLASMQDSGAWFLQGHFFPRVYTSNLDVFMQNVVFGYNFARICGLGTRVDLGPLFHRVWNSKLELFPQNVVLRY